MPASSNGRCWGKSVSPDNTFLYRFFLGGYVKLAHCLLVYKKVPVCKSPFLMSGSMVVKRFFRGIPGTCSISPLFRARFGTFWSRPTFELARGFVSLAAAYQQSILQPGLPARFYASSIKPSVIADEDAVDSAEPKPPKEETNPEKVTLRKNYYGKPYNPVDLATSLDYVNSEGRSQGNAYSARLASEDTPLPVYFHVYFPIDMMSVYS
ncbi:hypothetical protein AHF37_11063 [Paragonimus kellicotti]|nr:hypothetical protein AHF37_11063 [Paragonimus kellicotti]